MKTSDYYNYKADFISAYKNNGNDVKMALAQVCMLRDIPIENLKTILRIYLEKLTKHNGKRA